MNEYIFFSIISVEQRGIQLHFKRTKKHIWYCKEKKKKPGNSNACYIIIHREGPEVWDHFEIWAFII